MSTNPTGGTAKANLAPQSVASLLSDKAKIRQAIDKIQALTLIADHYKKNLISTLEGLEAGIQDVADVYDRVDAVVQVIINPVTNKIEQAGELIRQVDKNATTWAYRSIAARLLGVVVGAVAVHYYIRGSSSPPPPLSGGKQVAPLSPAKGIGERLAELHPTKQVVKANTPPSVLKVESLVTSQPQEARDINRCEDALKSSHPPNVNDLQTRAADWYAALVCYGFSRNWEMVARLAQDWGVRRPASDQQNDLKSALYGSPIRVYEAEALLHTRHLPEALKSYETLERDTASGNSLSFLSPIDFKHTELIAFVRSRHDELEALRELSDPHIEIYNHREGVGAKELAEWFIYQGLTQTEFNRNPWPFGYSKPQICFNKHPSEPALTELKHLVASH